MPVEVGQWLSVPDGSEYTLREVVAIQDDHALLINLYVDEAHDLYYNMIDVDTNVVMSLHVRPPKVSRARWYPIRDLGSWATYLGMGYKLAWTTPLCVVTGRSNLDNALYVVRRLNATSVVIQTMGDYGLGDELQYSWVGFIAEFKAANPGRIQEYQQFFDMRRESSFEARSDGLPHPKLLLAEPEPPEALPKWSELRENLDT